LGTEDHDPSATERHLIESPDGLISHRRAYRWRGIDVEDRKLDRLAGLDALGCEPLASKNSTKEQ
jgi:hypothetical protein